VKEVNCWIAFCLGGDGTPLECFLMLLIVVSAVVCCLLVCSVVCSISCLVVT